VNTNVSECTPECPILLRHTMAAAVQHETSCLLRGSRPHMSSNQQIPRARARLVSSFQLRPVWVPLQSQVAATGGTNRADPLPNSTPRGTHTKQAYTKANVPIPSFPQAWNWVRGPEQPARSLVSATETSPGLGYTRPGGPREGPD
jgi:hypothetical protein